MVSRNMQFMQENVPLFIAGINEKASFVRSTEVLTQIYLMQKAIVNWQRLSWLFDVEQE